ncbi:hypothetical protein Ahy_B08g090424 [Arachis hypogaea]|uniref:Uncharacterized protein n=1 Tax=Arachis hypogaea TaxID=3818 RepID=A0A444Y057_ARAHY|nr:hypothetical protein Ahy_B08g090424 [Arachis hypogaea]
MHANLAAQENSEFAGFIPLLLRRSRTREFGIVAAQEIELLNSGKVIAVGPGLRGKDGNLNLLDDFQNRQAAGETDEEAFESLFGKEQPGRVRCYGRSITRRDLKKHAEISELKQQHQEEDNSEDVNED